MSEQFSVKKITDDSYLDIRHVVLWPEGNREGAGVPGDDTAEHYGVYAGDELISCLSVFREGETSCRIRKFATLHEHQGKGCGSLLMATILEAMRGQGVTAFWLDARTTAVTFYERYGFQQEGDLFVKKGVDYFKMRLAA